MEDLDQKIIELMDLFDDEQVTTADKIDRPQQALDREAYSDFMKRNPMAGGGMLVQPGFDGTRQGYAKSKGKGIQLTKKEQKLLKDSLSTEDFNKLDFDRTGLQSGQKNYGVGRNDDRILLRKVRNILNPGQDSLGVKILNNKNWTDTVIKLTNQGKSPLEITNVLSKKDSKITRNVVSSAINALIDKKQLNKKYYVMPYSGLIKGDFDKKLKIVEKLVNKGELGRADIGRKAGVADSVVEKWIRANKGDDFYETNYTYEKGLLKKGNLQNQKDLFNLLESKKSITAAEVSKIFKINNAESKKLMADLVGTIYRMSGSPRANSLVVPYDDENRMREVLRKIRNAPDFEDIYQRRIGTLVREAYPKGPKRNQAVKALGEYYKFSRALKEVAPELALSLDHVVPFQFLKEVEQGKNPMNLIKVKPIPTAINIFKSNFDAARIDINRALQINPTDKNALNKFKVLKELEQITPLEFGGVSTKGNVYDFKAKPIGQSNLIEDAIEGLRTYNRIGKFSKQVLTDEALQKKFIESGVVAKKDFGAFKRIKPLSKAVEDKVINTIVSYSKLKKCQISLNAEGGRIGFANSVECITDGLNEAKKAAGAGDKKAARQLVETAEAASKGGRLLKNVLGPGAILGEAVFEGAIIGNKVLGGKPLDQAWAESYLSYLDPRKYSGQLDPTLLQREQMLESTADKDILKSGFAAQDQLSAFNKAIQDRDLAKARGRIDQYNPAAADVREQARFADQSADIISSEAFKDASNIAKEYIQGQEGKQRFNLGILGTPRGELSEDRRMFEANKAMKNLYAQYSDDEIRSFLKQSLGTDDDALIDKYLDLTRVTERIVPSIARTLSGLDVLRTGDQIQQATQRIADAGGVANLAKGGRVGFKLGKLTKLRKSKVREEAKAIIDDSIKKQKDREFSPNLDLDVLIKKTLDEDFFDKKDRIIDTLNVKAARERKNFPYNQQVQEEPSQLNFYDDIVQSDFRTKTGPFFDYQKRKNRAGGGILKQAGDSSGPPPESGPMSEGLQGLMKRGIKT
jgi:hypothetical protein